MTDEQKEIIKLMKEWKNEVKQLVTDYNENIAKLNTAREEFNKPSKGETLIKFVPYIVIIILFAFSLYWLTFIACGGAVKLGENQITIPCQHKTP